MQPLCLAYPQVPRTRTWIFLESHYSTYHQCFLSFTSCPKLYTLTTKKLTLRATVLKSQGGRNEDLQEAAQAASESFRNMLCLCYLLTLRAASSCSQFSHPKTRRRMLASLGHVRIKCINICTLLRKSGQWIKKKKACALASDVWVKILISNS